MSKKKREDAIPLRPESPAYKKKLAEAIMLNDQQEEAYLRLEEVVNRMETGTKDHETHQAVKVLRCLSVIGYLLSSMEEEELKAALLQHVGNELQLQI